MITASRSEPSSRIVHVPSGVFSQAADGSGRYSSPDSFAVSTRDAIGVAWAVAAVSEIPIMLASGKLIRYGFSLGYEFGGSHY